MTVISKSFAKRAMMVLAVLFTALTADATEFITDVILIGTSDESDKDDLISKYTDQGWSLIDNDLNAGAGGDYIYLLYKSVENTDGLNRGYITDFYIFGSKSDSFDEELTFQGRTYQLVPFAGGEKFIESKGDLNRGCGKGTDYIHLYYTMDPKGNDAVSKINFDNNQMIALGNMGLSGITGYNLNAGCSSDSKIYMHIATNNASPMPPVKYIKYTYDDKKGLTKKEVTSYGYYTVTSGTTKLNKGWYVLSSSQSFDNRITVSGTVNLILCDGCTLEAKTGIEVAKGNTLNIFAQSEGTNAGKVTSYGAENVASIGVGEYGAGGEVTIYGGEVEAHGGRDAAGIGGGLSATSGCTVTVYGGSVKAFGGIFSAGIGGGLYAATSGTVTIYGGTVEAHGGDSAAGIGGGYACDGGTVTIYGGTVEAKGGENGVGIGGGRDSRVPGTLTIGDGVKVYGGDSENPTTVIATGPQENVGSRPQYMIVQDYLFGDANDDDKVNAADLVEMVNAKNNKASDRFVLKNADIDGSGNITKSDIDGVEKIIMQK